MNKSDSPFPAGTSQPLTPAEERVILHKGTEPPFSGAFWNHFVPGVYHCRRCGVALYASSTKFASSCGWPSFDDAFAGAVRALPDADGLRTEIVCAACGGHLGHVFTGEGFTSKNARHCVNSLSLSFQGEDVASLGRETAIFAGGCFWGVEHAFQGLAGVLGVTSGYTGGHTENPSYEEVCSGETGHAEAVRVEFDPAKVGYEELTRLFFELHDPTQLNRQGPDFGTQYRSAVFYADEMQKRVAEKLMRLLRDNGYDVVTELTPASVFYPAEEYHQAFFLKHPGRAFCHARVQRFERKAR